MKSDRQLELRVGSFFAGALVLLLVGIWMIGSTQNLFTHREAFFITVPSAGGIAPGAKVTISGVNAGVVDSFSLNAKDRTVHVRLSLSSKFDNSIRKDSFAEVITEGVLGDKLIAIAAGSMSSPKLPAGSEIPTHPEATLQQLLGKGGDLATNLSNLAEDLDQLVLELHHQFKGDHLSNSLGKLDSILGKIDNGNGTAGGLVNDPALYDDVKALLGESNDNRIVRNIVRQTVKGKEEKKANG